MRFNLAREFLDGNLEAGRGDKVAVRWTGGVWSYRDAFRESCRFANALRKMSVRVNDLVQIALPDGPEIVAALFGTTRMGAVAALSNPIGEPDRINARVVVTPPEYARMMAATSADPVEIETGGDDPAMWIWSGGTTGRSKAVVHRHRDFQFSFENYARRVLRMDDRDVTLSVPKLFFAYATGLNLLFPLAAGATICLFPERSTPEAIFENIRHFKPTVLVNVPTIAGAMARHPDAAAQDLSCLRIATSAGEALPAPIQRRWQERFGVELLDGLGSAEMFHIYISQRIGETQPGILGSLVPGYEGELRDESDGPALPGEISRLWVRGGSAGIGYHDDPERTSQTFRDGWVKTADLFRCDPQGCFTYAGRADDLFKVDGQFVAPLEIEELLLRHPAVAEAAACGYTDEDGLVKTAALVVPRPGTRADAALAAAIQEFARKAIAPHKRPRRVRFVAELPRTDRGKLDRKRIPERVT
jgi:benzoate-CoA ligase family protein